MHARAAQAPGGSSMVVASSSCWALLAYLQCAADEWVNKGSGARQAWNRVQAGSGSD